MKAFCLKTHPNLTLALPRLKCNAPDLILVFKNLCFQTVLSLIETCSYPFLWVSLKHCKGILMQKKPLSQLAAFLCCELIPMPTSMKKEGQVNCSAKSYLSTCSPLLLRYLCTELSMYLEYPGKESVYQNFNDLQPNINLTRLHNWLAFLDTTK